MSTKKIGKLPGAGRISGNIFVPPSTSLAVGENYYPAVSKKRGLLVIVNCADFRDVSRDRPHGFMEQMELKNIFEQMGFLVKLFDNKGQEEIVDFIGSLVEGELTKDIECFVLAFLSHGDESGTRGAVRACDYKIIDINWILSRFTDEKCANLKGIPKIFIFATCRSLPGKLVVDPYSTMKFKAHVFRLDESVYSVVLGLQNNENAYYVLQLLESNDYQKYVLWQLYTGELFSSVQTSKSNATGSLDQYWCDLDKAIKKFEEIYQDLTGNSFGEHPFVQQPGKYYDTGTGYDVDKHCPVPKQIRDISGFFVSTPKSNRESKLAPQVQDLLKLIFDVEMMERTMSEFRLNTREMPLQKLSPTRIRESMMILKEISEIIKGADSSLQLSEASNRFYMLIPHDFGAESPPVIDSPKNIVEKSEMLQSLLNIERAVRLLNEETDENMHPIDKWYEHLQTYLNPLDEASDTFKVLSEYVSNTHYAKDTAYKLEVVEIFEAYRKLDAYRYSALDCRRNRKLLWHGSRLSSIVGILSHGLQIPPPALPNTGYKFGKGVYFTDMASKCAEQCAPTNNNDVGLLLLCEVALADAVEFEKSEIVRELPHGKHSVKGIGRVFHRPEENFEKWNGSIIPKGSPVEDEAIKSDFLYNEYVVYDKARAKSQYLVKVKFNYEH